jgi:hypothetical protein
MRRIIAFTVAGLLTLAAAAPALAEVAQITATAPLADPSEGAVRAALREAVAKAARGAAAMGLDWVTVSQAVVGDHAVAVRVLATDVEPSDDEAGLAPDADDAPGDPRPSAGPRTL